MLPSGRMKYSEVVADPDPFLAVETTGAVDVTLLGARTSGLVVVELQ